MLFELAKKSMDPFEGLKNLQREMNRIFTHSGAVQEEFPPVNAWSNEEEIIMTVKLPGMALEDINISVIGDQLTIEGERKFEEDPNKVTYYRKERDSGGFVRCFKLPFAVNEEKASAIYKSGILKIVLHREETSIPKKLTINAE